ncbi:hypothetical protein [Pseudalkalibacillus salsuginis]|uniref:hypothetical protein n=1 Tax=Pseudalkalibacillus salsuginis TaxID=2910972 RepID=UPI001F3262C7|nr:hypothetical protein [Pseudalkalibacillus salsuginis]MCF6409705.1 hypothetical protein [Pseudalkalibacillus salsuginis]
MSYVKLEETFDLDFLKQMNKQLNDIQLWATCQRCDEHNLYHVIDNLCRVAGMYNDVIEQHISDGYVTTGDPQVYINNKMTTPNYVYQEFKGESI